MTDSRMSGKFTRIPARMLARELTKTEIAQVGGGGGGQYTKTLLHGEMGDYISP